MSIFNIKYDIEWGDGQKGNSGLWAYNNMPLLLMVN
jgi:hypothetical protein